MKKSDREIEVRFLEIYKSKLIKKLKALGAKDLGEELLKEVIFADKDITWPGLDKLVRVRTDGKKVELTYKHHQAVAIDGALEVEVEVSDFEQIQILLKHTGLVVIREQEKKRHTFKFKGVTVDIDTWPKVPTYVEIEGKSEKELKQIAAELGFDWKKAVFEDAGRVLHHFYNIDVRKLKYFTFAKVK
ncbi:MAG: class IV adenylate cyclase [Candidatus Daviesbacteria bacterium]|nr:class IV adenylate cyclase [Candidatus Daviesbacteria bacterium]